MTEEESIREAIALIQAEYKKQIQPYVERLVAIESCRPPRRVVLPSLPGSFESSLWGQ